MDRSFVSGEVVLHPHCCAGFVAGFLHRVGLIVALMLVGCQLAVAEGVSIEKSYIIGGIDDREEIGGQIFVPEGTRPTIKLVGCVTVADSEKFNIAIKARDAQNGHVPVLEIVSGTKYLICGKGQVFVDVISSDKSTGALSWDDMVIELGETPNPPPDPDPPPGPSPNPSVPDDPFDNIGKRVAKWAKGLPSRPEAGRIYRTSAGYLKTSPSHTIDSATKYLVDEIKQLPGYDQFKVVTGNIETDLQGRWPLSRGVLADYYIAIAVGLEAVE